MSLYSNLLTVLTPYANKIKQNEIDIRTAMSLSGGAPVVVGSTSDMTDTDQIYVLSTDGNWYYHNGTAWVAGGEYGAVATDITLTRSGIPADGKTVGDAINAVTSDVAEVQDALEHLDENIDIIFPTSDHTVDYTLISGSYVKKDGSIATYSTWTRTDYVPCSEGEKYKVHWDVISNYNCFYDSSKGFLSSFSVGGHGSEHALYETFTVPAGAAYFILSNVTTQMTDFDLQKVVPDTYDYTDLVEEVQNIRTGVDGIEYNSAGEAVRTQIEQLHEIINNQDNSGYGLSSDAFLYANVLPSYYIASSTTPTSFAESKSYLDNKIAQIPKNGKSFIYITDTHIDGNAGHSTEIINYIRKRTGINTVLFGGDVFGNASNKYLAAKKVGTYMIPAKRAFGYDFIPTVGDHDYNTVNVDDDEAHFLPYSQIEEYFVGDLERRSNYHYYDASSKLSQYADPSSDDYSEAMSFFKTVYYVDDNSQQIRYIVLNTGCGGDYGAMYNIFGTAGSTLLRLQADWLADTLKTTPNNYDVIVLSHKGNTSYVGTNATVINGIMYGAKVRASVYPHPSSARLENIDSWWPNTKQYDFSDANPINRIIAINGHHHGDELRYFGRMNGTTNYSSTQLVESGSTIHQPDSDGALPNTCQIPIIVTSCDSLGVTESYSPSMAAGTVTEQCFDIVTLTDDAIVMTRIGAGEDRILYVSKEDAI